MFAVRRRRSTRCLRRTLTVLCITAVVALALPVHAPAAPPPTPSAVSDSFPDWVLDAAAAPSDPVAAAVAVAAPPAVTCTGDGTSGNRVQVLYLFETGADHFAGYEAALRQAAWEAQVNVNDSARRDGGQRILRFVHNAACQIIITKVELPPGSFTGDFTGLVRQRGFTASNRVYLMLADGWSACGNADPEDDPTPGTGNRHNSRALYVRVGAGCLTGHVITHELSHSLGGLIPGAPHNDGTGHCTDGQEILCQDTHSLACPDQLEIRLLDCGRDDYFGVTPRGTWLPTHWNMATDSLYLTAGTAVSPLTATPPLPPQLLTAVDVQGTSAALTFRAPGDPRGITDYQIMNGTAVAATLPAQLGQSTVRITGLSRNTQYTMTVRSRAGTGGAARLSVASQPLILRTGTSTTPAGAPQTGAVIDLTNDIADPSGKLLAMEVGFSSTDDNAAIIQYPTSEGPNQQWRLAADGAGFTLTSLRSNRCLAVLNGSTASGAAVVQSTCNGASNQRWSFVTIGGLTYQLRAAHSNLCIQAQGFATTALTPLVQGTCATTQPTQRWTVHRLS